MKDMSIFQLSSLIPFIKDHLLEDEWLIDVLNNSKILRWESPAYCYLSDEEQVEYSISLAHPEYWIVVFDITKNGTIRGIEFVGNIEP